MMDAGIRCCCVRCAREGACVAVVVSALEPRHGFARSAAEKETKMLRSSINEGWKEAIMRTHKSNRHARTGLHGVSTTSCAPSKMRPLYGVLMLVLGAM